jgi:hypothetical protein
MTTAGINPLAFGGRYKVPASVTPSPAIRASRAAVPGGASTGAAEQGNESAKNKQSRIGSLRTIEADVA